MFPTAILVSLCLLAVASAQQVGTLKCTASGCTTQSTSVVLDANWRWLHSTTGSTNRYTGNTWDKTLCPNPTTCAANCALDGADYSGTYGITTSGNALTLKFVTGANIGSRVYLMADAMFQLLNQEFTFDVDMSNLDCGLNGALYFSEMPADGGMAAFPTNKAGANEMDIWEANKNAAAYTPHVCTSNGQCSGTACGDGDQRYNGQCDKDGCDFNSYRMGDKTFLGPGLKVNTNSKFTVVTQFITNNNSTSGTLTEIRRLYVQNSKIIQNSASTIAGVTGSLITDAFCTAQKTAFGDTNGFGSRGGLAAMGRALGRGMVLALSIWDDHTAGMYWLDSSYPTNASVTKPGVLRGPCSTTSGDPKIVEANQGSNSVTFSNIKSGPIGSTFTGTA
ncbi:cellobiohydrolaseI [Mycena rebaudengoi]|nr:cellobiohydrolaseI [Mycena rebaudengoi]